MSLLPLGVGKAVSSPPVGPSVAIVSSSSASSASFDSSSRRTAAQSNAAAAASTAGSTVATPRKGQGARKQHRNTNKAYRRPDDDDAMAEARALRNSSSRRGQTSITHLLNYAAPSRAYLERAHDYRSSQSYRGHHGHYSHHGHHSTAVDKARFVHANYRFVVSPTGDYTRQAADADEHVEWADVLQVLASTESQASACPICLSEPVAPRMAKCGHIFCLACLIRFMHASTDADEPGRGGVRPANSSTTERRGAKWKKCPICEDSIYLAEVRPVRFYAGQECALPRPGDDVVLRLIMRHASSTVALPREGSSGSGIPWHFAANVLDYARIMKGTGDYMVEQYERELEELERQEREDELLFHEDGEWSQRAARAVRTARETMLQEESSSRTAVEKAQEPALRSDEQQSQQEDFFFYMAPPHLYLSPLDIRILKTKYGAFSSFPSTLLPRVEHLSLGHTVDDAMRRRAKYLGHLPAGCVVSFLECDWTDIVPAETLAGFAGDIERRRKRNRDKAAQEERERLQAERLELAAARSTRRLGAGGGGGRSSGGRDLDSTFGADLVDVVDMSDFLPLGGSGGENVSTSSSPPNPRPGFGHLADLSTSPTTVWGTRIVASSPHLGPAAQSSQGRLADVDDGWLRDEQLLAAGDLTDADVAAQMAALGLEGGSGSSSSAVGAAERAAGSVNTASAELAKPKKKKKQKITLMSTGSRRGL
ncbi:ring finger domain containing protein [Grosmannia clavigera kw1407]|uniref:Ring finger domain containing protein n=1 Tax=Grosmannia clavigera (strain kw1407 / UAMH 11150) TaxID=655863 RepID=F0XDW3_GROCL|nr:ring finger domain containing protein [Grosmannia clavigera kw1407]EFX03950.1 ring finger domain containing protein [Grosmannia clavigera kw1407]